MSAPSTRSVFAFLLIATLSTSCATTAIVGRPDVIDADSLTITGQRIRLRGIDAPETDQVCTTDGRAWKCGVAATEALRDKIGHSKVTCLGSEKDRYDRTLARCSVSGTDLNAWLVREGWALAYRGYSTDYVAEESRAKAARVNLWGSTFVEPWTWRHTRPVAPVESKKRDPRCLIKGNINAKGDRIYHVPASSSYSMTTISAAKGERWFCTEEDALAAGWRAPRN